MPQGPGVRDDSGAYEGGEVPIFYDPMISKLITWGDTRDHALQRMRRALAEYEVRGIRTTIPFFKWILEDDDFKAGRFDTSFIDRKLGANGATLQAIEPAHEDLAAIAAAVHMFTRPSATNGDRGARAQPLARRGQGGRAQMIFEVAIGDRVRTVSVVRKGAVLHVTLDGHTHVVDARRVSDSALSLLVQNGNGRPAGADRSTPRLRCRPIGRRLRRSRRGTHGAGPGPPVDWMTRQGASSALRAGQAGGAGPQRVVSPMPGKIVRVLVKAGDHVTAKQGLVVVEAMKMENELRAARDGRVRELSVTEGQSVDAGTVLLVVE